MKKKLLALLITIISVVTVFALAGCGGGNVRKTEINDQSSIIIVPSNDVLTITDSTTVADYLNALKEKGKLEFESETGDYGLFITSMDGKANVDNPDHTGYSWMIYIDFIQLDGDDAYYGSDFSTCEYDGVTLYGASYGISGLPCAEGHTYAFVYEAYDYSEYYN